MGSRAAGSRPAAGPSARGVPGAVAAPAAPELFPGRPGLRPSSTGKDAERVFLVDGSGYIFRAYYAVAPLSTKKGFPTNALFGFSRMLLKLVQGAGSPYVTVVFDAGRATFRTDLYADYKANRSECPEDLVVQMPYFRRIVKAIGLPSLELQGFEADDVIGTLASRLSAAGREVVIVTGDKDIMQLVDDRVSVWDTMQDRWYGSAEVREKLGVAPANVADFLGLTGDSSDNIPGLEGVGPKTAAQLIDLYGGVDAIIGRVDEIREDARIRNRRKISDQVAAGAEKLLLSRTLATIDTAAPVLFADGPLTPGEDDPAGSELVARLRRRPVDRDEVAALTDELEFGGVLLTAADPDAAPETGPTEGAPGGDYRTVYAAGFDEWCRDFASRREYALDLETTSLDTSAASPIGVAFCWDDDVAYYIPIGHTSAPEGEAQVTLERFLDGCRASLEDPSVKKVGQNLKYDVAVLAGVGVAVKGVSFDTMVAAYLVNPDRRAYNLASLAADYLGRVASTYKETVGDRASFADVEVADATMYAAEDAHFAWLLKGVLAPRLVKERLVPLFDDVEMPLVPALARMERRGILLDTGLLGRLSGEFAAEAEDLARKIHEAAGGEFNINSPKQLAEILFDKLGISTKGLKRTKTGVSTDSSVLERLGKDHPLPALVLRYRGVQKLKNTYVDALPSVVSPVTGRVHTKFNQTVTGTGRLSSSDPNLQNIPIQTPEGRRIRSAFVAPRGRVLLSADYSQIELRVLAHMSGDESLVTAFREGVDVHERTARELLGLGAGDVVTPRMRRLGKTINFGVIYGMSSFRLSGDLDIEPRRAQEYIDNYFRGYPGVKTFFKRLEAEAESLGYVTTMFGRKRYINDLDTEGRGRGFLLRAAVNAPIQGTAADIVKTAMVRLDDVLGRDLPGADLLLQIHDELVIECDEVAADRVAEAVRDVMEHAVTLAVPLKVDVGIGKNWDEAH